MNILVLESSTTSAKGMLYDTSTGVYSIESNPFEIEEDSTKQDARKIYSQLTDLGKKIINNQKVDLIVLGSAWHSLVLLDRNYEPITSVYTWTNTEASEICSELRLDSEFSDWYYRKTGCMVNAIYPAFKLMLLKQKGIDLSDKYIMGQGSYNSFRLTGKRFVSDCMASGSGIYNITKGAFDDEILSLIGITKNQLGEIVEYTETAPLNEEGARLLGLQAGIPVVMTQSDGGLNQVGAGAIDEGVMTFSVGTSGAIRFSTKEPILPEKPSTWCYKSPYKHMVGAATSGATNCIDWFKNSYFTDIAKYEDIEQGLVGNQDSPTFLPFIYGERCPGWQDGRNGGFLRIKPYHTRFDMYHSILEGVLFNIYQCYEILTELSGKPKKIMLSGGILNSEYWTQMCVDIFNIPMETNKMQHSSLLGGILLGMDVLNIPTDEKILKINESKTMYPNTKANKKYMIKYEQYLNYYNTTF